MSGETNQRNKQLVHEYWQALDAARAGHIEEVLSRYLVASAPWHGPDPVNDLAGVAAIARSFWGPLREAFPDVERHTHIFFGGQSSGRVDGSGDGRMWVCGTGELGGTFASNYLSIPATGDRVRIRWGEFCCVEDERIVETYLALDLVDLMQQAGFDVLPVARGKDGLYPPPQAGDGVLLDAQDGGQSRYSLDHIRRFIFDGLNSYDQSALKSMGMADYFHPQVKWYGPGGIGACLSFRQFEDLHQRHWLHAFPDRRVQDLNALIAEGAYSGGPGWAGVTATHSGEYLGCPATGRSLQVNGLDFWKRDGEQYIENWVFVDMIHLFRQMGVDLFERLHASRRGER